MLKHQHADVGVAVSIRGLITPIVRAAETKTLSVISNEVKDMASRAKTRKLKPNEYEGRHHGGVEPRHVRGQELPSHRHPPHATILAVGAGEKRMVVKHGEPAVATVMTVTLSTTTAPSTARSAPS